MNGTIADYPPPTVAFRAECETRPTRGLDALAERVVRRLTGPVRSAMCRRRDIVADVDRYAEPLAGASDDGLRNRAEELRYSLGQRE